MLVECRQCGAPLDVDNRAVFVKCAYCGANNRVRSMKTLAAMAPVGWVAPQTWTPPNQSEPLPFRAPPKQANIGMIIIAIVVVTLLLTTCPFICLPFIMAGAGFS